MHVDGGRRSRLGRRNRLCRRRWRRLGVYLLSCRSRIVRRQNASQCAGSQASSFEVKLGASDICGGQGAICKQGRRNGIKVVESYLYLSRRRISFDYTVNGRGVHLFSCHKAGLTRILVPRPWWLLSPLPVHRRGAKRGQGCVSM